MIVNGASRRSISFWSQHLANDKKNDRAELKEIRGLAADNLRDGLREMQEDARHTRCKNFFYQANFNPCAHEHLTEDQWQRAFQIFETERGIPEGTARIVYEHEKYGRVHRHVIWSRIDLEHLRAWPDGLDAKICHTASREISEELGLEHSVSPYDKDREGPRPDRALKTYEMFRGFETGLDPRVMKKEVTALFRESDNPADFIAGLRQRGYEIVQGDKRDFCILDSVGDVHSLARRIDGVNAKQLRTFMQDIQRHDLPTIEQAKTRQRELMQQSREEELVSVQREIAWEDALAKAAIEREMAERQFVEPTRKETRERDEANRKWPVKPPKSEPTKTSPGLHFEDSARQVGEPKPEPVLPENLKGTAALIWTAFRDADNSMDFAAALDKDNIRLVSVTKEEAERSQRVADFAGQLKNFAPRYREGEIVAVTEMGNVYKLNQRTTGADRAKIDRLLTRLDRSQLMGIEKTKEFMKGRSDARTREVQAFRDLLRDAKQEERNEKARDIDQSSRKVDHKDTDLKAVSEVAAKVSAKVIGVAFDAVAKVGEGLIGIFDPPQTPVQRYEGEVMKRERESDAQHQVDLSQYLAARTVEQQQLDDARGRENRERER